MILDFVRRGGGTYLQLGGGGGGGGGARNITRCRRQCIHFSPSFFSYQDGLSWHLRAFALQIPDVRGLQAAMCFFLAQISLTNVIRTYMGILDCGLFPSRSVLASQPLATSIAGLAPDQQLDSRTSYVHKVSRVSLVLSIGQPLAV